MYQMVQSGMASSQARDRLLAAAVGQARRGGIGDLSLRELAAAIGTSHRMLLYHFGSREGLLTAVARAVDEAERVHPARLGGHPGTAPAGSGSSSATRSCGLPSGCSSSCTCSRCSAAPGPRGLPATR